MRSACRGAGGPGEFRRLGRNRYNFAITQERKPAHNSLKHPVVELENLALGAELNFASDCLDGYGYLPCRIDTLIVADDLVDIALHLILQPRADRRRRIGALHDTLERLVPCQPQSLIRE